ncbi:hypothetical protein PHMEG_00010861 [Phytophthora megakarya]|uniref:Eukaryotic/viral aspartic protease n=1 Tax=Phytophthora megakarya TaxID=4795 RepID=A0A225WEB9_9STRA|nr:hypothetical protein PHMEG_00010861 [Phytophthora megakarya]
MLARNLTEEFEEVAGPAMDSDDDGSDRAKPSVAAEKATSQPTGFRPPINGDTTGANKVIGKTLELMKTKSSWMRMFGPTLVPQTGWMTLGDELVAPIDSTSTRQVVQDTVMLLGLWVKEIAPGRQVVARHAFMPAKPSKIPLPQTPIKSNKTSQGVFGSKGSQYMHDSHMMTPRPHAQQADRRYELNEDSFDEGDDLFDYDCLEGDIIEVWPRRIRELSAKEMKNTTPKLEITTHLPLGNIKQFSGYRNKGEKSMQWLSTFIYDMKGTHTPPNDWCMAFELSLLNGYARNTGVQFQNGGRESKDHVENFLDTCDDRGLEEGLCHVRVKDIYDLEDMINDILMRRDRKSKRETSVKRSHSHNNVTVLNEISVGSHASQSGQYDDGYETNADSLGDGESRNDDDNYSNGGSEYNYAAYEGKGLMTANEHERRAAAEGAFARSDNSRT